MKYHQLTLLLVSLSIVATNASAVCQAIQTPAMSVGLSPLSVYDPEGGIDHVNPVNGNIFLSLPLLSYPQRGKDLSLAFNIYYNDKQWYISNLTEQSDGSFTGGVWSWWNVITSTQTDTVGVYVARDQHYEVGQDSTSQTSLGGTGEPYTTYEVNTTFYGTFVRGSDGAKHYIADSEEQTCIPHPASCPSLYYGYGNSYPSSDATGLKSVATTGDFSIEDPNGVTYTGTGQNSEVISDKNGNSISSSPSGWTDSLGRIIPGSTSLPGYADNSDPGNQSVGVDPVPGIPISPSSTTCPKGTTSAARQWVVPTEGAGTQTYYLCYSSKSYQTAFNVSTIFPNIEAYEASSTEQGNSPALVLTAVILPNKTSYQFSYDSYLSLSEIDLPTGGVIKYVWQNIPLGGSNAAPISRAIQSRTVIPGAGQPASSWTYYWDIPKNAQGTIQYPIYSVVTNPEGNDEVHQIGGVDDQGGNVGLSGTAIMTYSGCAPQNLSSNRVCAPSNGSLLKTVSYVLTDLSSHGYDPGTPPAEQGPVFRPTTITSTLGVGTSSVTSKVINSFAPAYGTCSIYYEYFGSASPPQQPLSETYEGACYRYAQPTSVTTYNFGSIGGSAGSALKTTTTTYHWQVAPASAYLTANLLNLVDSVVTTDGSGVQVGKVTYGYDEGNGSPSGILGNNTSVTSYLNTGTSPKTQTVFNSQGMPSKTIDAKNNTTSYTYDATGAFLSEVQNPATLVAHNDSYTFDKSTGLITSHTDQNLQVTRYQYNTQPSGCAYAGSIDRLTEVDYADGGKTTYCYDDAGSSPSLATSQLQSSSGAAKTSTMVTDGFGRVTSATVTSGVSGAVDSIVTTYDSLGRLQSVSNPYRTSADLSYGITSYSYDALGRKTYQCQPDNSSTSSTNCVPQHSFQSWTYNGNVMTFQDEAGNQWQRTSDSLGRLTSVFEPDPSSNKLTLETDYSYDALGNLISVNQKGGSGDTPRVRTFTYDSLSRLICASNPENSSAACPTSATTTLPSGVIAYSYDANGNVSSKTDARGVVTGYNYDTLNRLLSKSSSGYLTSCYQYDGAEANGTGRLANEWTQTGASCPTAAPSSGAITLRSIQAYDQMGRIKTEQECAPGGSCTTSSGPQLWYGYDLAGNQTCLVNSAAPTTTLTVGTPPCLSGVFGTPSGLLMTNSYDPAGHLQSVTSNWTAYPTNIYTLGTNGYGPVGPLSWTLGPKVAVAESYSNRLRVNSITASPTP